MSDYVVIQTDPQTTVVLSGVVGIGEKGDPGSAGAGFPTRAAMAGSAATHLDDAYLTEAGREGWFVFYATNLSAQVTLDTFQAKYVAPASDTTGASGAWVRQQAGKEFPFSPEMAGAAGDTATDDAPEINYLLTQGNVKLTPGKIYGISQAILGQDNVALFTDGAELRIITASYVVVGGINAVIGATGKTGFKVIGNGIYNANKMGIGGGAGARINGVMFLNTTKYELSGGWTVKNCTGYGRFSQNASQGVTRDGFAENCEIYLEDMAPSTGTVDNVVCSNGDGDIASASVLHPVFNTVGTDRMYYSRIKASLLASAGVESTGSGALIQRNIYLEDCDIELSGGGGALVLTGAAGHVNFNARNCRFASATGLGANISKLTRGRFTACRFEGGTTAFSFTNDSEMILDDCTFVSTAGASAAFGISNASGTVAGSHVQVRGGRIEATTTATHFKVAGAGIRLNRDVQFFTNGTSVPRHVNVSAANNYWLALEDQEGAIILSWAGANQTARFYPYATVSFEVGSRFKIMNTTANGGGSTKTIVGEAGVTLVGAVAIQPYGTADVEVIAPSTFAISGDVA